MPWKKQFDVEDAAQKAQQVFWRRGFEATSMEELLASMGINRGSFYDTFGSKRDLYLAALRAYDQKHRREVLARLGAAHPPREAILALFAAVRAEAGRADGSRGCFLANATLERAADDADVAEIVREAYTETEAFFRASIEAAQRRREIRRSVDAAGTARTLLGLLLGMRVLARAATPRAVLDSIVAQVAELI
jgi:TetR/AcrR family transcriptional repressor of nem operon